MAFSGTVSNIKIGAHHALHCVASATTGTITGVTAASPAVVTDATHGLVTGDRIRITAVVGMTELNNRDFYVEKVDADTFKLVDEDSSAYTAYASAGTWTKYTVTDFGFTEGGSEVSLGAEYRSRAADQTGTTSLGRFLTGESLSVTLTLKECTPANIALLRHQATAATTVGVGFGGAYAGSEPTPFLLVLRPLDAAATSVAGEVVIYKAVCVGAGALSLPGDGDRMFRVSIEGHLDTDRAQGKQLGRIGAGKNL
jgi:hypothetical protein